MNLVKWFCDYIIKKIARKFEKNVFEIGWKCVNEMR